MLYHPPPPWRAGINDFKDFILNFMKKFILPKNFLSLIVDCRSRGVLRACYITFYFFPKYEIGGQLIEIPGLEISDVIPLVLRVRRGPAQSLLFLQAFSPKKTKKQAKQSIYLNNHFPLFWEHDLT